MPRSDTLTLVLGVPLVFLGAPALMAFLTLNWWGWW